MKKQVVISHFHVLLMVQRGSKTDVIVSYEQTELLLARLKLSPPNYGSNFGKKIEFVCLLLLKYFVKLTMA